MSEQTNAPPPGVTEADMKAVADRTNALLQMVRDDSTPVALDSLISAYVNEGYRRDRRMACASMLLKIGRLMLNDSLRPGATQAQHQGPGEVPPTAVTPIPAGYTAEHVAAIERLLENLATLLHDAPAHVALSALLTMYVRIAEIGHDQLRAGEHLCAVGGRMVVEQVLGGAIAAGPAPAPGTTYH